MIDWQTAATPKKTAQNTALDPLQWALTYRRIDGRPLSLDRHEPLKAIYADDHPHIVVIKPAQVGVSEMAISRVCHALDHGARFWGLDKTGLNVAYLFPTKTALEDFSKERFSGLRVESEYMRSLFASDYDATDFKQAGESYLYLRGMESESSLLSFPADMLVYDEYDRMSKLSIALAKARIRASSLKHELKISTPTLPNVGIHGEYLTTDQRRWYVTCEHCKTAVTLDFFRDVYADNEPYDTWRYWHPEDLETRVTMTTRCPQCKAPIDRCGPGQWIADVPEVTSAHGYHVPWFAFPTVDLNQLAKAAVNQEPTKIEEFFRSDLGLTYAPEGTRLNESMMKQLGVVLPAGLGYSNVTMGVDVGSRLHYRISGTSNGKRTVMAMGAVRTFEELTPLMSRYRVRLCVIDAMPETHKTTEWAAKHSGKVLRAFYPNGLDGELYRKKEDEGIIQINRTMAMDQVFDAVARADEVWPATIANDREIIEHMCAPIRVLVEKPNTAMAVWTHTAPDHYYHAALYDRIAYAALPKPVGGLGMGSAKGWT